METKTPKLTGIEQQYFGLLMENTEPLDRSYFEHLHNEMPNSNVVDVHMGNLRRKLAGRFEIEAVRGVGYIMRKV